MTLSSPSYYCTLGAFLNNVGQRRFLGPVLLGSCRPVQKHPQPTSRSSITCACCNMQRTRPLFGAAELRPNKVKNGLTEVDLQQLPAFSKRTGVGAGSLWFLLVCGVHFFFFPTITLMALGKWNWVWTCQEMVMETWRKKCLRDGDGWGSGLPFHTTTADADESRQNLENLRNLDMRLAFVEGLIWFWPAGRQVGGWKPERVPSLSWGN
ncbi:hypothetical protein B0T20DRAFT_423881 [Sordaria brevicollis]|uniref:Transmembrane protein n=1 Tax=Sordaria brevicollis TaxID=83679 RepID=A0AAE0P153_SORBR|nr:hypothetical protein B0T20DRAFT_423881 [Sordaria brevicollis]